MYTPDPRTSLSHNKLYQIASAQLAVDREMNSARSRVRSVIWRRTRIAQISLSFSGAFCPTSFPLFHGSRDGRMPADGSMRGSSLLKKSHSVPLGATDAVDPNRPVSLT